MNKGWIVVIVLFIVIVVGMFALVYVPSARVVRAPDNSNVASSTSTAPDNSSALSDTIVVTSPTINGMLSSPLTITGKARGSWYFEASAPVVLLDSNGSVIAQGNIHAQGEWMTTDFVPFSGTLTFDPQPVGSAGTLVLSNDNPSGDPTKQKTLDIPVHF